MCEKMIVKVLRGSILAGWRCAMMVNRMVRGKVCDEVDGYEA